MRGLHLPLVAGWTLHSPARIQNASWSWDTLGANCSVLGNAGRRRVAASELRYIGWWQRAVASIGEADESTFSIAIEVVSVEVVSLLGRRYFTKAGLSELGWSSHLPLPGQELRFVEGVDG